MYSTQASTLPSGGHVEETTASTTLRVIGHVSINHVDDGGGVAMSKVVKVVGLRIASTMVEKWGCVTHVESEAGGHGVALTTIGERGGVSDVDGVVKVVSTSILLQNHTANVVFLAIVRPVEVRSHFPS